MKPHWIAALSTSLFVAAGVAQDASKVGKAAKATTSSHYVALDKIIGAEVRMQAAAAERREAAEDGEQADRPKGEIENLIIDTSDGSIDWAIVSVGGLLGIGERNAAVPLAKLQCTTDEDGDPVFTIAMTKADLEARPKFDASEAKKEGLRNAVRKMGVREAGADKSKAGTGEAADKSEAVAKEALSGPHLVLASDMKDFDVHAMTEKFGSVDKVFVDRDRHCVDFVVVSHGGVVGIGDSHYLVPLAACKLIERDDTTALQVSKTKEEFASAPKYEEPESGREPLSAELVERSCDFFAVRPRKDKLK